MQFRLNNGYQFLLPGKQEVNWQMQTIILTIGLGFKKFNAAGMAIVK
jgi:hypothetical protein